MDNLLAFEVVSVSGSVEAVSLLVRRRCLVFDVLSLLGIRLECFVMTLGSRFGCVARLNGGRDLLSEDAPAGLLLLMTVVRKSGSTDDRERL